MWLNTPTSGGPTWKLSTRVVTPADSVAFSSTSVAVQLIFDRIKLVLHDANEEILFSAEIIAFV